MQILNNLPGLKVLLILWAAAAIVWSTLEGNLLRLQLFAVLSMFTVLAFLFQRVMIGRRFTVAGGLLTMAVWGLALGVGSVLMSLFLMAVKTGLHAHGPEFTVADIATVWRRLPLWSIAGLLSGLGLGLLLLARTADSA